MGNDNSLSQSDIDALLAGGLASSGGTDDNADGGAQPNEPETPKESPKPAGNQYSTIQPLELSQLNSATPSTQASRNIDLILDVPVELTVELARKTVSIKEILEVGPGSIVELPKLAGEPVEILVNSKLLARGEVVVINENFGVRIIDIIGPEQRIKNLK